MGLFQQPVKGRRMRTIYLDNNATTAVAPEVREAMEAYFTAEYFNPSSAYDRASPVAQAIKRARFLALLPYVTE